MNLGSILSSIGQGFGREQQSLQPMQQQQQQGAPTGLTPQQHSGLLSLLFNKFGNGQNQQQASAAPWQNSSPSLFGLLMDHLFKNKNQTQLNPQAPYVPPAGAPDPNTSQTNLNQGGGYNGASPWKFM